MKKTFLLVFMVVSYLSVFSQENGAYVDTRDGKIYKTIQIGTQLWMAENMNYETPDSWCIECETYGRVYTFKSAQSACPEGWHLASDLEWTILVANLGGFNEAGEKLKETGTEHWKKPNKYATNESGFTAIPHGYRSVNGILNFEEKIGFWWTSTIENDLRAWSFRLDFDQKKVTRMYSFKEVGLSVRCIKD